MAIDPTHDIDDLVSQADKLIRARKKDYDGLKEIQKSRNVHYYIQKGLIEPPTHRGKLTVYTDDALHKLVFIRIIQAVTPLGLREIKDYMDNLKNKQIVDVAKGKDMFHFRYQRPQQGALESASRPKSTRTSDDAERFGRLSSSFAAMAKQFAETAAEFAEIAESYSEKDEKK